MTGQGNGETTTSRQLTEVSEHVHHTAWLESSTVKQGKAVTEIVVLHIDLSFCFFNRSGCQTTDFSTENDIHISVYSHIIITWTAEKH